MIEKQKALQNIEPVHAQITTPNPSPPPPPAAPAAPAAPAGGGSSLSSFPSFPSVPAAGPFASGAPPPRAAGGWVSVMKAAASSVTAPEMAAQV